jgi:hypothetical protein
VPYPRSPMPDQTPPAGADAATPWLVFAAMIICLAVLAAARVGLGHPAGWLERAAGRGDMVPHFAPAMSAPASGRAVRIVSLATAAAPESGSTAAAAQPVEALSADPSIAAGMGPGTDRSAGQAPAALHASAQGRTLPARTVSRAAPLRVYVAGDSAAEPLGYELQRLSAGDGWMTAVVDFKVSSGLANPGYFNWPARLGQALATRPAPEAVVLFLGGNDHLLMRTAAGTVQPGQSGWAEEYARRAGELMDLAGRAGARVYWVGMPVVHDRARNGSVAAINAALVAAAAGRPWVRYLDVAPLFGDVGRDYSAYRLGPSGEPTKVRQDDGVHLARAGSIWVAELLYDRITQDFVATP